MTKKHPPPGAFDRAKSLRRDMTDSERKLWAVLRADDLAPFRFRRQVPIGRFIADFICHQAKLIIEVDGGQHDPSAQQEVARTAYLRSEGYRVLRFWNNDVILNMEGVHATIVAALVDVSPSPNPPPSRGRA